MSKAKQRFNVNPHCKVSVSHVGMGKTPLVVIDMFSHDDGENIRSQALSVEFKTDKHNMYPGVRADLPKAYVIASLQSIYDKLYDIYAIPPHLQMRVKQSCFSLITKTQEQLHPQQLIPHFDTPSKYFFAVLHYLGEGEHGGTGLFRHISTGFESINQENETQYLPLAAAHAENISKHKKAFFTQSDDVYELYHTIEYKPNRLVIYPGHLLHSTIVDPQKDISANTKEGRLTANIFIEYE